MDTRVYLRGRIFISVIDFEENEIKAEFQEMKNDKRGDCYLKKAELLYFLGC